MYTPLCVRLYVERERAIVIPQDLVKADVNDEAWVEHGVLARKASLEVSAGNDILLSDDLIKHLGIAQQAAYRILVRANSIRLGPVIGVLAAARYGELSSERLRAVSAHFFHQVHRGGLLFAFSRDAIDLVQRTIAGYRYSSDDRWHAGVFPLPQVVFRRYGVGLGSGLESLQMCGVKVFNERLFHKGEAWQWMARTEEVGPFLPDTVPLEGINRVLDMLKRHDTVYVKPVWGSLATGIIRIKLHSQGYFVTITGIAPANYPNENTMIAGIKRHLPRHGIVQQGLDLVSPGGRLLDFRLVVQKDISGKWSVTGIVARAGEQGLHVSNMATGGFPLPVEHALKILFGDNAREVFMRMEELTTLGVAVGESLDHGGLLIGDLGLDIAYDKRGHPWVIEANNRDPDHNIAWESGNWPLFYKARATPVDFACYLAGFGRE